MNLQMYTAREMREHTGKTPAPPGGVRFDVPPARFIRCRCGEQADTVHFLPYVTRTERIEFACPDHDPGGYWLPLAKLNEGPDTARVHIYGKAVEPGHISAIFLLDGEFDRIRQDRREQEFLARVRASRRATHAA